MAADGPLTRRSGRPRPRRDAAAGLKPLRRRPKQLDAEPTLLQASPSAAGGLVLGAGAPGRPPGGGTGSGAPGISDEPARLLAAAPADAELDPRLAVIRGYRDVAPTASGLFAR